MVPISAFLLIQERSFTRLPRRGEFKAINAASAVDSPLSSMWPKLSYYLLLNFVLIGFFLVGDISSVSTCCDIGEFESI